MRKLNTNKIVGSWYDFPEDKSLRLKIRPLDILSMTKPPTKTDASVAEIFEWFNFILIGWEGFVDENDNPLECNEANKKNVYMYDQEVVAFCMEKSTDARGSVIVKDADNLKKSQDGGQVKTEDLEIVKAV